LRYIFWALIWILYALSMAFNWLVIILSKAGTWPISTFNFLVRTARDIWQ
jgi:hypothetical protein